MTRKYHNHKLQTTPWHREEEPLNHHKTPGRQNKQTFFESICGKTPLESCIWADKITKKERKYFTYGVQCINKKETTPEYDICVLHILVTILTAAWFGVTKIQICWSGAIVTTITNKLVWCKCNIQHR